MIALVWMCAFGVAVCMAEIRGPERVAENDLVELSVETTPNEGIEWEVRYPIDLKWFAYRLSSDGAAPERAVMVFSSAPISGKQPDCFVVTVFRAKPSDDGKQPITAKEAKTIYVGIDNPKPPDPPKPPEPPRPASLEDWVATESKKITGDSALDKHRSAIANHYTQIAESIKIGTLKDPRLVLQATVLGTDSILQHGTSWNGFRDKLSDELNKLKADGKLATIADYESTWRTIAKGLSR